MQKGNNIKNVSTTRGVKGGYAFSAPFGTPLPTDIKTRLDDAFNCVGFIANDGFVEGLDGGSSEVIQDLNGDNVDTYSEKGTKETVALTLIEMSEESLSTQYGYENVSQRDGMIVVKHDWSNANDLRSYVLELVLKNGRRWRKVIPAGVTSERGEFTGNSTTAAGREVTITYTIDGDNAGCWDYIELEPGSATGVSDEKLLENMTVDELKEYALVHNIDIEGKTLKADILAAIKTAEAGE